MTQLICLDDRLRTKRHVMTCDCGFAISGRSLEAVYAAYEEHVIHHHRQALESDQALK